VRRIPLLLADPFLVAVTAVWDLLLFAKNLFVAAKIVWHEVRPSRGERDRRAGSSITLVPVIPDHLPAHFTVQLATLAAISTAVLTASSRLSV
jgi:hypothetical protein